LKEHDGNFTTPRPEGMEEDDYEMCESLVRDLIGGKKSGNTSEQLKAQHETNLEDF